MKNKTLGDFCTLLVTFVTLLVFSVSFANAEDSPSYSNDFDAYANDTVDLEDGTTITGAAARILDGRLQLTPRRKRSWILKLHYSCNARDIKRLHYHFRL